MAWARDHAEFLGDCDLIATGTTGGRLNDETPLSVTRMESGALGGDLQIGVAVVTGDCDAAAFFSDSSHTSRTSPRSCASATSAGCRWRRTARLRRRWSRDWRSRRSERTERARRGPCRRPPKFNHECVR